MPAVQEAGLMLRPDVSQLMREGFRGLGRVHVVSHADDAVVEAGVAVHPAAIAALCGEPLFLDQPGEAVP